jgi:N-acetylglucosamine-6-sulfatase
MGDGSGRCELRPLVVAGLAMLAIASSLAAAGEPAGGLATARAQTATQARPNVIVVMTDDQDANSVWAMPQVRSLLGEGGTRFTDSFVNYPLCCPSRATFLTGQYARNHGVLTGSGFSDLDSSNTLAVWLQGTGYATAHVGKYVNGYGARNQGGPTLVPPGWSEWYGAVPDVLAVYDYNLNENGTLVHYGSAPEEFKGDVLTQKAVDFIQRRASEPTPFFLSVGYTAPHGAPNYAGDPCPGGAKPAPRHVGAFAQEPLPRPPSFGEADVSDKPLDIRRRPILDGDYASHATRRYRCRLGSLLHVDEGVGAMAEALRSAGELDETLIVFTSDNGFFQGEHRIPFGKIYPYDEAIRVPLLVRGPGIPAGTRLDALTANADLAPTILDAASVPAGLSPDGISLLDLIQRPERERELLIENHLDDDSYTPYTGVLTSRYVYVEYATGERELYDLSADPFQLESLHSDPLHAKAMRWLAGRLAELRDCQGIECQRSAAEAGEPGTRITRRPRRRLEVQRAPSEVRFGFRASEPSTFECKLDARRWRPCRSPQRYEMSRGRHRLRVRATDVAGETDPSPAEWKWTVKPR